MIKLIGLAVLLTVPSNAVAADPAAPLQEVTIAVSAADLAGAPGHARLMKQVSAAAEQLCGSYATVGFDQWGPIDSCRKQAFRSVEQQLAMIKDKGDLRIAAVP